MKRGMQWPIGVAVILALTVGSNVWLAIVASSDEAYAVEPDYYRKAVRYDDEMARRAESAQLGWMVTPALRLGVPGTNGRVEVAVTDRAGAAIDDAQVEVVAMHNARASRRLHARLVGVGRGRYAAPIEAWRPGEWELRFTVTRGGDRFAASARVQASPSAP